MQVRARGIALACMLVAPLAACSTANGPDYQSLLGTPGTGYAKIDTLFGNYLAAQEATRNRDNVAAANYYARALKRDPDNYLLLERAFTFEVSAGNEDRAGNLAARIIKDNASNRMARLVLAVDELGHGRMQNTREHLDAGTRGLYNGLAIDLITAWTWANDGEFELAEDVIDGINALGNEDLFQAYQLGLIYDVHGSDKLAEKNYKRAVVASGGGAARIVNAYGRFLERHGRGSEAIELYETFHKSRPDHPVISASLRRAISGEKTPDRLVRNTRDGVAEALYSVAGLLARDRNTSLPFLYLQIALWASPDTVETKLLLGELYWQGRQFEKTARILADIPLSHPFAPNAAVQIALSLERMKRPQDAEYVLRRAIKQHPRDISATIALGDILRASEQYERAVNAYDRAFEIVGDDKGSWFLYYSRGASLEQAGFWPEAERDLLAALERAPDQPIILNHLGYSWVDRGVRLNEGLELVQTAVDLSPGNGFIVDSLGWAYFRLGEYSSAVRHLERALELEPEDPTLHEHLGDAYWMAGRQREARFQWQHSLDREPTPEQAVKVREKLVDGLAATPPST